MGTAFLYGNGGSGGGAGLNFEVVGNPKPLHPKENTIWVNTDLKILGYIFNQMRPVNLEDGMVWIATGDTSGIAFNALKKNCMMIYPRTVEICIDGEMTNVEAEIYQGGEWHDATSVVFFADGAFNTETFGNMVATDGGSNVSISGNNLAIYRYNRSISDKLFDVTGFDTIEVTVADYHSGNVTWYLVGENGTGHALAIDLGLANGGTRKLDISDYEGKYYFKVVCTGNNNNDHVLISSIIFRP